MSKQTAKDNWHESYREKAFSLAVSNRIRYLTWKRQRLLDERGEAFDERDNLLVDISGTKDKAELQRLKSEHSDVVRRIDDLKKSIAWHDTELARAIKNADDAKLFEDAAIPEPPKELFAPKAKEHKGEDQPARDPAKDDDRETGRLPVGVPDEDEPAAPPARAGAPLQEKPVDASGRRKRSAS